MDLSKLGSGDTSTELVTTPNDNAEKELKALAENEFKQQDTPPVVNNDSYCHEDEITPQTLHDNEDRLRKRIAQCKNIIQSLKYELNEEKAKLDKEKKGQIRPVCDSGAVLESEHNFSIPVETTASLTHTPDLYRSCVDTKLYCDENIMEYEKQLQIYQNTLNMAQLEKKNAIRKQMMAKAYKLKLLEVENQCNIELLRVKQSLQCLEPLQIIVNKWKSSCDDNVYNLNNFELLPRFPEISANTSSVDVISSVTPPGTLNENSLNSHWSLKDEKPSTDS